MDSSSWALFCWEGAEYRDTGHSLGGWTFLPMVGLWSQPFPLTHPSLMSGSLSQSITLCGPLCLGLSHSTLSSSSFHPVGSIKSLALVHGQVTLQVPVGHTEHICSHITSCGPCDCEHQCKRFGAIWMWNVSFWVSSVLKLQLLLPLVSPSVGPKRGHSSAHLSILLPFADSLPLCVCVHGQERVCPHVCVSTRVRGHVSQRQPVV